MNLNGKLQKLRFKPAGIVDKFNELVLEFAESSTNVEIKDHVIKTVCFELDILLFCNHAKRQYHENRKFQEFQSNLFYMSTIKR